MRSFYLELLADSLRSDRPGFVNFEWPELRLTISVHSELAGSNPDPARIIVNLSVSDMAGAFEKFSQRGVPVVRAPEREGWGGWVCTVVDPDGNYLQLLQLPQE